jgi:C4-dicarboxylate-specific signal transduction histidine kinase
LQTTSTAQLERKDFMQGSSANLLQAIAEGMHSMAQPLTVLRATLEVANEREASVDRYQQAIHNSLVAVVRVVDAMGFVHELVRIAHDSPDAGPVEVRSVLDLVAEDLQCLLDEAAISLKISVPNGVHKVVASAARLRQCQFYLVQHALSCAPAGSVIEISVRSVEEQVGIFVCNQVSASLQGGVPAGSTGPFVDVDQTLALAEALAVSLGGSLRWRTNPFAACLCLPTEATAETQMLMNF